MTCTYDRELLALYLNGDATAAERAAALAHLESCAECREILRQHQAMGAEVAGSLGDLRPAHAFGRRRGASQWRVAAIAAAVVLALLVTTQVPAVAAMVGKVFPWITIFELDKQAVDDFITAYSQDQGGKVFYPTVYETVAEAEEAWGGQILLPTALPEGMELDRIEVMHWDSGEKDATFAYWNPRAGGNLIIEISTRPHQRHVPRGATSEVTVNGEKAVVIRGTFGRYPGQSLKWEPDSDLQVLFPLGDLYYEVSTMGEAPDLTLDDLISIAESIR
ncbi:MAG: hypothetical protein K0R39_3039 [Symbiobacteriaceae bacterium]|jgi:hypothetical protein|nr:hypothetical protein [Symbiobacteriaceae bacterium]